MYHVLPEAEGLQVRVIIHPAHIHPVHAHVPVPAPEEEEQAVRVRISIIPI